MEEIEIEGISGFLEVGLGTIGAVVVGLNLEVTGRQIPLPAGQDVAAGEVGVGIYITGVGFGVTGSGDAFAGFFAVEVALKVEGVTLAGGKVNAKSGLGGAPVVEILAVRVKFRAAGEALSIDAVIEIPAIAATVPEADAALLGVASADGSEGAVGVFGRFGDDVDDTVHGVRSPDGAAGASNDLDTIDII